LKDSFKYGYLRTLTESGRLGKADLLVNITCMIKNNIYFIIKSNWFVKEVNCTDPSPSVRIPWLHYMEKYATGKG
jgi:hypothetical protein